MRTTGLAVLWIVVTACGPATKHNGDDDANPACIDGATRCTGLTLETCAGGSFTSTETCPQACDDTLGCVVCVPGTGTCSGETSHACLPDGSGYFDEFCDPVMGSTCDAGSGICVGACSSHTLGQTYIGCDYYATVTSQLVQPSFQFAIAASNTTSSTATVTIDGGALTAPLVLTVAAGAVATQYLPWVPALKTCNTQGFLECGAPEQYGALAVGGGYHVRSTQPITLYQFSPLDYTDGQGSFSYSNDASLLLPTNAWDTSFRVPSWQAWAPSGFGVMPGLLAVTAVDDNTQVTITPRADTTGGNGAPSFTANTPQTVTLNHGDVLQLLTQTGDLTGSLVESTKRVEVMGGHHCTQTPIGYTACDHIEESVFPVKALSTQYLVTAPFLVSGPRAEMVRVLATADNTTVTLDPATAGGPFTLAAAGDFIEIPQTTADFQVKADKKVLVAQYMESQDAPGGNGAGDPGMTSTVPVEQYRSQYQFHAPTNYESNYVNITAPMGTDVMLDGVLVQPTSYTAIGSTGFGVARMPLANAGTGTHVATGSMPFGVSVYGYGQYTSYWYPGGLDLQSIVVQ